MTDSVTVELITDPPPVVAAGSSFVVVLDAATTGEVGRTGTLQRFTCGHGCGFIVNTN